MKKLQEQHPRSRAFDSKSEADIAEFCERMSQLQETMENWLTDTGITVEAVSVSLVEFLIGGNTFSVPGIHLRYENRMVKFTPVFLYGQGVVGCVEVTLCTQGKIASLYRLFMRSSDDVSWTWSVSGNRAAPRVAFSEDAFFDMIGALLPE
ncbi:hypothetical protein ACLBW0_04765 [Enterobacteriaceae bacterium C34A]